MNNYKILKNLDNVKKGKIGEEIARRYLVLIGMKIICSNYKTKFGEIDIIAKVENKIVFIEVKSRTSIILSTISSGVSVNTNPGKNLFCILKGFIGSFS